MRRFLAAFALRGRDELHKEGLRREATPAAMARFDIARFSIAGKDVFRLDAYLRLDQPYDCAGAAKIESLGIALVEWVRSDDPTALIGLPLIRLVAMLGALGVAVPPG